jgi:hypothetical protein
LFVDLHELRCDGGNPHQILKKTINKMSDDAIKQTADIMAESNNDVGTDKDAILFGNGEDLDVSEKLVGVLNEIFTRFDQDKDGEWTNSELDAFAIACNGTAFDDA